MPRLRRKNNPQSKTRPQKSEKAVKPGSFDELVVESSLARVKIRVFPSRRRDKSRPNDKLLIELQCEV